jgi:hypothetical protein
MSWTQLAPDRWSMQDADGSNTRHLLLRAGGRSIELHGHTVHVYDGPNAVVDPQFPLGVPGATEHRAVGLFTDYVNVTSDAEAWAAMAGSRFTVADVPPPAEPEAPPAQPAPPAELPPATPPALPGGEEEEEG